MLNNFRQRRIERLAKKVEVYAELANLHMKFGTCETLSDVEQMNHFIIAAKYQLKFARLTKRALRLGAKF